MANNKNRDFSAQNILDEKLVETIKNLRKEMSDLENDSKKVMKNLDKAFGEEYVKLFIEALHGIQKEILTTNEQNYQAIQAQAKAYKLATEEVESQKNLAESILFNTKNKLNLEKEQIKYLIKTTGISKETLDILTKKAKTEKEKNELLKQQEELLEVIEKHSEKSIDNAEKLLKLIQDKNKELHETETILEKVAKVEDKVSGIGSSTLKMLTGITGQIDTVGTAAIFKMFKSGKEAEAVFDKIGTEFKNKLTWANTAMQFQQKGEELMANSIRMNLDYYNSQQRMFQETGMQRSEYQGVLNDTVESLQNLSITSQEANSSFRALYEGMNSFSENKATQKNLTETVATLKRLGVQESTAAKSMNDLNKIFKQTDIQSANTTEEVTKFAVALGINTNKAVSDLSNSMAHLAAYPAKDVIRIFKELEIVSKKTGLEIKSLTSLSEKFDTFESAADAVGGLNTFLKGPYLNTMDLINAKTPVERIQMLTKALNDSGQSFDSLGRYGQIAFAERIGTSVEEASKLFNNQVKSINSVTKALDDKSKSLDTKKIAENNSTTEQLTTSLQEQAAGITTLNGGISALANVFTQFNGIVGYGLIILQGLSSVMTVIGIRSTLLAARKAALTAASVTNTAATGTEAAAIEAETVALNSAAVATQRLSVAKMGIAGLAVAGGLALSNIGGEPGSESDVFGDVLSGITMGAGIGAVSGGGVFSIPGALIGGAFGGIGAGLSNLFDSTKGFASGTDSSPSGLAIVGEKGPEIVSLPGNSSVINNSNTNKIVEAFSNSSSKTSITNSGAKNINLNVTLKLDQDVLAKYTKTIAAEYLEDNMNIVIR